MAKPTAGAAGAAVLVLVLVGWMAACGPSRVELTLEQPWTAHTLDLYVVLSRPGPVSAWCVRDADPTEVHRVASPAVEREHHLRLAGLIAAERYTCVAEAEDGGSGTAALQTDELVEGLPELVIEPGASGGSGGESEVDYVVANVGACTPSTSQRLVVFDRDGEIRWVARAGSAIGPAVSFEPHGDHVTFGGGWLPNPAGRLQQMDWFGEPVLDAANVLSDATDALFHHEARELDDGRFLTIERVPIVPEAGPSFFGFRIRRFAADGTVDFDYHGQRALDEGHLPAGEGNAWHANWADVTTLDGRETLLVSLCFLQRIVAIDLETGDWRWTLSAEGDLEIDSDAVPECQHGVQADGSTLLVYDNGLEREASRIIELELDEQAGTATEVWRWTEEGWFEPTFGSVQRMPGGHVLVGRGHNACFAERDDVSQIIEVDPGTGERVWTARFPDDALTFFRALPADGCGVFANERFCPPG